MNAALDTDVAIASIAAVIGDPTRARMLVNLLDGCARTATELAAVAEVGTSTASVHLHRLEAANLITVRRQGKHRYYSLSGADVAALLERMSALAGITREPLPSRAPVRLRAARTCYDHIAGTFGVALRDRFARLGWLAVQVAGGEESYEVTAAGAQAFTALGIDLAATRSLRRRFAFGCLDWTERRYHLGGSLGAAFLAVARARKWVVQDLDSRALRVTARGEREMRARLGPL